MSETNAYPTGGPPSGSPWGRFATRLPKLLLTPKAFWTDFQQQEVTAREVLFPHLLILIGVRSVAGFVGSLLGGDGFGSAFGALISSFVAWMSLVYVFAIVAASLAGTSGGRLSPNLSLRYAAYGLAPVFLVGMFAVLPFPHVAPVAELIAMPYAFIVLAHGVVPFLGVDPERAPTVVGKLCGALLILWSIMPTLIPAVVGAITT